MIGVAMSPLAGRLIDRLVPWHASVICGIGLILSQAIQTGVGGINIAAVVIATLGLDLFKQSEQVSLTTAVFQYVASLNPTCHLNNLPNRISPTARSRLNAVIIVSVLLLVPPLLCFFFSHADFRSSVVK